MRMKQYVARNWYVIMVLHARRLSCPYSDYIRSEVELTYPKDKADEVHGGSHSWGFAPHRFIAGIRMLEILVQLKVRKGELALSVPIEGQSRMSE